MPDISISRFPKTCLVVQGRRRTLWQLWICLQNEENWCQWCAKFSVFYRKKDPYFISLFISFHLISMHFIAFPSKKWPRPRSCGSSPFLTTPSQSVVFHDPGLWVRCPRGSIGWIHGWPSVIIFGIVAQNGWNAESMDLIRTWQTPHEARSKHRLPCFYLCPRRLSEQGLYMSPGSCMEGTWHRNVFLSPQNSCSMELHIGFLSAVGLLFSA